MNRHLFKIINNQYFRKSINIILVIFLLSGITFASLKEYNKNQPNKKENVQIDQSHDNDIEKLLPSTESVPTQTPSQSPILSSPTPPKTSSQLTLSKTKSTEYPTTAIMPEYDLYPTPICIDIQNDGHTVKAGLGSFLTVNQKYGKTFTWSGEGTFYGQWYQRVVWYADKEGNYTLKVHVSNDNGSCDLQIEMQVAPAIDIVKKQAAIDEENADYEKKVTIENVAYKLSTDKYGTCFDDWFTVGDHSDENPCIIQVGKIIMNHTDILGSYWQQHHNQLEIIDRTYY